MEEHPPTGRHGHGGRPRPSWFQPGLGGLVQDLMADPMHIHRRGRMIRVRHDDPKLGKYIDETRVLGAAMSLGSDGEGVRLDLYRLALATGMRHGELLALRWQSGRRPIALDEDRRA